MINASKHKATKAPTPGKINIVGLFEAEAAALIQAADRGKILHDTRNIRDSGSLLESTFRQIIGRRLPPQAQMAHGYLYDLDSACTPQIDAMVLSAADNYSMMTAEGDAIYAPFTSCRAYVEIKSSVRDAGKELDQVTNISTKITSMKAKLKGLPLGIKMPKRVGSVLLYANSDNASADKFAQWFSAGKKEGPTLVVFLDKAVVISRRSELNSLFDMGEINHLEFFYPFLGKVACLYKPNAKTLSEARGRVLLWLYYWLLYRATLEEVDETPPQEQGSQRQLPPVSAFIAAASNNFPLLEAKKLDDCIGQIPSFESLNISSV